MSRESFGQLNDYPAVEMLTARLYRTAVGWYDRDKRRMDDHVLDIGLTECCQRGPGRPAYGRLALEARTERSSTGHRKRSQQS